MSKRAPGSMRTRQSLSDLIEGRLSSPDGRAEPVRLATRLIVEEALEAESRDAVGREYYEHGAAPGQGYRNGSRTGHLNRKAVRALLSVHCILQLLPGPELRQPRCWNKNGRASPRVPARTGRSVGDTETAETDQTDFLAPVEGIGDSIEHSINGLCRTSLAGAAGRGDGSDQIIFVHDDCLP